MTFLSAFVLSFGAMLALTAIVAAWLFRTTPAPLWLKLILPAALVALACYAPGTVNAMLGLPVTASFDELPDRAELVAFVAHDEKGVADLWLRDSEIPRAYEVALDPTMKKTLRETQERQAKGERVMLMKRGTGGHKSGARHAVEAPSIVEDQSAYVIDDKAWRLPKKEGD
jgi:hypothetical protein